MIEVMIEVQRYQGINRTPALKLLLQGHLDLLDKGFADNCTLVHYDDMAVVAFIEGEPAGVISYRHYEYLKQVDICIAYVRKPYRRLGAYALMWNEVAVHARELKAVEIKGYLHMDNREIRVASAALGREEYGVMTRYILP